MTTEIKDWSRFGVRDGEGNKREKKGWVFSLPLMCEGGPTGHILPAEGISATEQPLLNSNGSHGGPMWYSIHSSFTGWCITPGALGASFPGGLPPLGKRPPHLGPESFGSTCCCQWRTSLGGPQAAPTTPRWNQDCQTAHAPEVPAGNRLKGVCGWASLLANFSHCPILSSLS